MNEFNDLSLNIKDKIQELWYKYKFYIIISVCVIIGLIIILTIVNSGNKINTNDLTYRSVETIMKNNAKEYTKNNKIDKNMYLSLNVLNLKINKELKCESISGVLKEQNNYYPYLVCDKYQSEKVKEIIDKNASNKRYGSLKGDNPYILTSGEYVEPGYDVDSKYTVNVKSSDIENGVNIINYYILENNNYVTELQRIVMAEDAETKHPIIQLTGNRTITIPQNSEFKEPGYIANDKLDGDITEKVKVIGNVNTSLPGNYKITYTVTNSSNKTTVVSRTIIVNQTEVSLSISHTIDPIEVTGNGVTITLNIVGNDYTKTVLPNNTESTSKQPTYVVHKNATYEFIIYDKNGNSEVYRVKIINASILKIDGDCVASFKNNILEFKNNFTSNHEMKSYIYKSGNNKSDATLEKTYKMSSSLKQASIELTDEYGNKEEKACKVSEIFEHYIFTGDSRTVGLSSAVRDIAVNSKFICLSGSGYDWFAYEAVPQINRILKNNNKYYIYILFGVNDAAASNAGNQRAAKRADKYVNRVNQLVESDWKDQKVVFLSVNPVTSQARNVKNVYIEEFNNIIKTKLSPKAYYCDTYTAIGEQLKQTSGDGLHYSGTGSRLIYNYVMQNCKF